MVYSCGHGVHGFTLDPTIGEFLLSQLADRKTPHDGQYYSVNESNFPRWSRGHPAAVRGFHGRGPGADAPKELALHRLTGRRLPPQPDRRRGLPVSGGHQESATESSGCSTNAPRWPILAERPAARRPTAAPDPRTWCPTALHQRVPLVIGWGERRGVCDDGSSRRWTGTRERRPTARRRAGAGAYRRLAARDAAASWASPASSRSPGDRIPSMYTRRPWTMRQYAGFGTAEATNAPLPCPARRGPDRTLDGLRPADPDGVRLRSSDGRRRGGPRRRGHRYRRRPRGALPGDPARRGDHLDDDQRHGRDPPGDVRGDRRGAGDRGATGSGRHGPERRPQGIRRPGDLHLSGRTVAPAGDRTVPLRGRAEDELQSDLDLRVPHPRGRRDRRAGGGVHPRQCPRVRGTRDRRWRAAGGVRAAAVVLLRGPQRPLRGGGQVPRRSPPLGPADARAVRGRRRLVAVAVPHPDRWRHAAGPAAAQQRGAGHGPGARGDARRHPVAAYQWLRRGAGPAVRGGRHAGAPHPADHRPRERPDAQRRSRSRAAGMWRPSPTGSRRRPRR